MQKALGESALLCAVSTYKKSCEFNDPWSCTMYGYHLAHGQGIAKDLKQSLKVLSKSCRFGIEDPACIKASTLIKQIKEALAKK